MKKAAMAARVGRNPDPSDAFLWSVFVMGYL